MYVSATAVHLSAFGTRALFFILIVNRTSRDTMCLFVGLFAPVRCMVDALHQRLKLEPVMWCGADVCVCFIL